MTPRRRLTESLVLTLCGLLLLQAFVATVYRVSTDSMAPTLHGRHRICICPRCGYPVRVGHGRGRSYQRAACPNCDERSLPLQDADEEPGDRLLVLDNPFNWLSPVRWEVVVFRWLGELLIKRVVGLPGETVELHDGDLYINGTLARKTLRELRALRLPVFDNDFVPRPQTWRDRWCVEPGHTGPHPLRGTELHLDNRGNQDWQCVTYRHFSLDAQKSQPLCNEYAYNGGEALPLTPVHDFLVECEVLVQSSAGTLLLGLTDGQDVVVAEIAVNNPKGSWLRVLREKFSLAPGSEAQPAQERKPETPIGLQEGHTHRLEFAFVDRRVLLAIDGQEPFAALDLPPATKRRSVTRPFVVGVKNGQVIVRHLRLFRDLHYTDGGRNAVRGQVVQLGPNQYFVLGDNSPRSQDSRFWPNGGVVSSNQLCGKPVWLPHPQP